MHLGSVLSRCSVCKERCKRLVISKEVYSNHYRYINADTLASLQIIQSESHPSAFNQGPGRTSSGSKESLSVYGLFHHLAQTPQGKVQLRRCFLRPSTDISIITERYDFISVFSRPDNASTLQKAISSLKKIKNLRPVMINLRKGFNTGGGVSRGFKTTIWGTLLAVG
jgi:DNA mismatch repair protein MSH5